MDSCAECDDGRNVKIYLLPRAPSIFTSTLWAVVSCYIPPVKLVFSSNGGDQSSRHLRDRQTHLAASRFGFTHEWMQETCSKITGSQPSAAVPQMKPCDIKHDTGSWTSRFGSKTEARGRRGKDPAVIQFKLGRIKITRASLERQVTTEREIIPQDELEVTKIGLQSKLKSEDDQY